MSYEFTKTEEKIIRDVGIRAIALTIIIILGAIMDIFIAINQFGSQSPWTTVGLNVVIIAQIAIGAVIFLPAYEFINVAKTRGNDIEFLMRGIKKMILSLKGMIVALSVSIILILIILFSSGR